MYAVRGALSQTVAAVDAVDAVALVAAFEPAFPGRHLTLPSLIGLQDQLLIAVYLIQRLSATGARP